MTISLHRSPLSQPTALLRRKYHLIYAPVEYTRSVCSCILFDYFWSTFRGGCNGIRCRQFSLCEIQYPSRPQSRGHACRSGDPPWLCHRSRGGKRSEEHTSELQSLMRISYAVFCLKKKSPYHKS